MCGTDFPFQRKPLIEAGYLPYSLRLSRMLLRFGLFYISQPLKWYYIYASQITIAIFSKMVYGGVSDLSLLLVSLCTATWDIPTKWRQSSLLDWRRGRRWKGKNHCWNHIWKLSSWQEKIPLVITCFRPPPSCFLVCNCTVIHAFFLHYRSVQV